MSNLYTVELTVRDVPLRIEYAVDTDEGPVLERIFIGSVRIYPVTNAQAVLHSFVHEAVAAMREDFEGVESALQDEEANRKHDEIDEDNREHSDACAFAPSCVRGAWVKP